MHTEIQMFASESSFFHADERQPTLRTPLLKSRDRVRRRRELEEIYQGFTLLELLIVTVIIGTLASMTAPTFQRARERAMNVRAIADIRVMESELAIYIEDNYASPVSLAAIGRAGMLDPWGNPYSYQPLDTGKKGASAGGRKDKFLVPLNSDYDLYSLGLDGESKKPLSAKVSQDDILRAMDGAFVGLAADF